MVECLFPNTGLVSLVLSPAPMSKQPRYWSAIDSKALWQPWRQKKYDLSSNHRGSKRHKSVTFKGGHHPKDQHKRCHHQLEQKLSALVAIWYLITVFSLQTNCGKYCILKVDRTWDEARRFTSSCHLLPSNPSCDSSCPRRTLPAAGACAVLSTTL